MILCRLFLIIAVLLMAATAVMLGELSPVFGAVVLGLCIYGASRKMHERLTTLGSARWAEIEDLRQAGMLDATSGLILGRAAYGKRHIRQCLKNLIDPRMDSETACRHFIDLFGRRKPALTRLADSVHVSIFAPTGVGKGVSFLIPWLKTNPEAAVCLDIKGGELARLTAAARRKMGRKVYIIDPYHCVTNNPATLNPVECIDKHSRYALDDCRSLAAAIVERNEQKGGDNNVHFLDNAEAGIAAVIATVVEHGEENQKNLQTVCEITSRQPKWDLAVALMNKSEVQEGMLARMGGNLLHLKDKELSSTMTTIARFLNFLSTPTIAATTRASSFDPKEILEGNVDLFFVLPEERVETLKPLLRMWIGTVLRTVLQGDGKTKINFICDEAGSSLGKMDELATALTVGRSSGIRLQLYYQDLGQLKKCWPDGADQTLLANTTQVFFGVNDHQTAEYVSNRLGEETIIVTSGGTSRGKTLQTSAMGQSTETRSWNWNENWQQNARRLLKPEEVTTLSPRMAITFAPGGMPPIMTRLLRWYEEDLRPPGRGRWWKKSRWSKSQLVGNCISVLIAAMMTTATVAMVREEWRKLHPRPTSLQTIEVRPKKPHRPQPYAVSPFGQPGASQPMNEQPGGPLGFAPFGAPGGSQPTIEPHDTPFFMPGGSQPTIEPHDMPFWMPGGSQATKEPYYRTYPMPGGSQPGKELRAMPFRQPGGSKTNERLE